MRRTKEAAAEELPADGGRRRARISPKERHAEFVKGAIDLFSEVGFDGGTRELAQRLGVTQPLLYRYFPSKEDLIAAVYREIYVDRWKPLWREILTDGSRPVRERLRDFYEDYTATIFTPEWLRIYLFAGLRGVDINRRYVGTMEREVLHPIAAAARKEFGLPPRAVPLPEEVELFWSLHGGIFYWGVRKVVYRFDMAVDQPTMIANAVDAFLYGAATVLRRVDAAAPG